MSAAQKQALLDALRRCRASRVKMEKASERRRALPPGSSRARVTTANAKWSIAAGAYQRNYDALVSLCRELTRERGA